MMCRGARPLGGVFSAGMVYPIIWMVLLTARVVLSTDVDNPQPADSNVAAGVNLPTPSVPAPGEVPVFELEPLPNYYIVKHNPVTITCKVAYALKITFKCADGYREPKDYVNAFHVDPATGIKYLRSSIEVKESEVSVFFGHKGYWCECIAQNNSPTMKQEKTVKSRRGIVELAYLKRRFGQEPVSSEAEMQSTVQLYCSPPLGKPTPEVFWLKDGKLVDSKKDINFIITSEGNLLINQARLSDTGNYTCGAQNLANKRLSEPATLKVIVNGGWSKWSSWTECSSHCGKGTQRRTRECKMPLPQNGGQACPGKAMQRVPCATVCPVDGQWSEWSSWSTCSLDCKHYRRRMCDNPAPQSGGRDCHGNDLDNANCTGGICRAPYSVGVGKAVATENEGDDNNLAMYIGLIVAVTMFITVLIIVVFVVRRKGQRHGMYDHDMNGTEVNHTHFGNSEKKLNKNAQDLLSLQPDVTRTVVTIRNHNALDTPNNNHINSMDKIPIYSDNHSATSTLTKNNRTLLEVIEPTNIHCKTTSETNIQRKESLSTMGSRPQSTYSDHTNRHSVVSSQIPSNLDADNLVWAHITHTGGRLSLPDSGVCVTIPEGAIKKGCTEEIFLAVIRNDKDRPKLTDTQTLLGPVILLGPQGLALKKPVILTFQHCASIKHGQWNVSVQSSDTPYDEPPQWQSLVTLGQETIITPVYCQLDMNHCHVMTDTLARYTLLGESVPSGKPTKILRLAAFAPMMPSSIDYSIRVYVVEDTQDALASVMQEERKLGARLLDKPKQILFQYSRNNLCLTIEDLGPGWRSKVAANYQEIPFHHVWSGNQTNLHCSFALEHIDREKENLSCKIQVYQKHIVSNRQVLHILCNLKEKLPPSPTHTSAPQRSSLVTQSQGYGGCNNSVVTLDTKQVFRMPLHIKDALCEALDKPNSRGNDWRMLAKRLGVDRYINYFATKTSPTEHIINLWEARHRDENATTDLMNTLRVMGRMDAAGIIEKDVGSWL